MKTFKIVNSILPIMGIFDKLAFWRKEDDFDFDNLAAKEMGQPPAMGDNLGLDQQPPGLEERSPFDQPMPGTQPLPTHLEEPTAPGFQQPPPRAGISATPQPIGGNRDLELISSKLDTVKAILTSMDQRIANLERAAGVEKKQQRLW